MSDTTYDLFQLGRRQLRKGMAAQATVPLEKAKRREPGKASIREALGIAYFRIRRWSEAEGEFRKVLELSPVNDYAHYALGRCLEKQGRDVEANRHYKLSLPRWCLVLPRPKDCTQRLKPAALCPGKI